MKKFIICISFALLSLSAFSQQIDTRRKIEVMGSAETEVTPDIIYLNISLKEYFKDNKRKVDIETLENQLHNAVLKAGIPEENFTINNISSYNNAQEKKKNPDFLASKQYRIKVTNLSGLNPILSAVDPKGIAYTNIDGYDYSQKESLKKDLKIKALKAAKEKAAYLAAAVNDKLGDALEIQEINNDNFPQPFYRANVMMKSEDAGSSALPDIDFKQVKLECQVRAVFELTK